MRLINVETLELEDFFGDRIPPYAILSHTWGPPREEVSFSDIERGEIEKPGDGTKKLKGCCHQAKEDHFEYAWIDTCCINKDSSTELSEAINSMFQWYSRASVCYVYLSDVPSGDKSWDSGSKFFASRWFLRGWTLQELLAPKKLCFYDQTWKFIGRKEDMSSEVEMITGIPRQFLLGWADFRQTSIAQRMSWAAKRKTTRKEDLAYCLLGIFDVTMPMIYGEGSRALTRLQLEIMKNVEDHSILAWGLYAAGSIMPSKSTDDVSAGILATAPEDFANCGPIVLRKQDTTLVNTSDISGGRLRIRLSLHTTAAGEIYGLLNCGPEHNPDQVVGIPLKTVSGAPPDEYLRPQGHCPILLSKAAWTASPKTIYIRKESQGGARETTSRRYWLRLDGHQKINLKLNDIYPPVSWESGRTLIAETADSDENIARRYLVRFRTHGEGSRDLLVVFEFERRELQVQARCHVMTSSRDTASESLSRKLMYMRLDAYGKQTAKNGNLNVKVAVEKEHIAQEPMFVVRLARASSMPKATVDADWELQQVDRKLEFVSVLQQEDQARLEAEQLSQERDEGEATLHMIRTDLVAIQERLEWLKEEQRLAEDALEKWVQIMKKEARDMEQLTERYEEIRKTRARLVERGSEMQQQLDEHETKHGPGNWLETIIKTRLNAGEIGSGLKDAGDSGSDRLQLSIAVVSGGNTDGQSPLSWAAASGYEAVARLLLEKGANVEWKDNNGVTPLGRAAQNGHEAVARLLLEKGADVEAKDSLGQTPLALATENGHETVAKLLLETETKQGRTRLLSPASVGNTVESWDPTTGRRMSTLGGNPATVESVDWSRDSTGGTLASDKTVKMDYTGRSSWTPEDRRRADCAAEPRGADYGNVRVQNSSMHYARIALSNCHCCAWS